MAGEEVHRVVLSGLAFVLAFAGAGPALAQEPPAKTLAGRVVDENGAPVAGACIGVFGSRDFADTVQLLARPPITSGADGTFAVPFAADRTRLAVVAAGRQACERPIAADGELGDFVLPPGAKLVGRVRDEQGAPLAGVRIVVASSLAPQYGTVRLAAAAVSNERGIFQVPGVPRTGLRMTATADGYLAETRLVGVESPTDLTLVEVGMVRGVVVDGAGKPRAKATVRAVAAVALDRSAGVLTAADGTFAITVPVRGSFRLQAWSSTSSETGYSELLRGAAADVVVKPLGADAKAAERLEVTAVDVATKQPLPKFTVSFVQTDPSNVQAALFHGRRDRKEYEGIARIDLPANRPLGVCVEAPGHGFELVALPADQKTLTVELGPEAVLKGRVLEEGTGAPLAGVAVRALPSGNTSGSGGNAKDAGPLSDAQGNFVIRGLRPGDYGVQAHAEQRAASNVHAAKLLAGVETVLDVKVPKARFVEVELTGTIPPGPAPLLHLDEGVSSPGGGAGFFQHSLTPPPPVPLTQAGSVRLGPTTAGRRQLLATLRSRTRVGSSATVVLGDVDPDQEAAKIALSKLASTRVPGHLDLPTGFGGERLAVRATRTDEQRGNRAVMAGVDAAGRFELEVAAGRYALQVVDLDTGIVFHTEDQDLDVADRPIVLKPRAHVLQVDCVPAREGDDVVLHSFVVEVDAPRDNLGAFLQPRSYGGRRASGTVSFAARAASQRWLVPAGSVVVKAQQNFAALTLGAESWTMSEAAAATVEVDGAEHKVVLEIPAAPSDTQLAGRR